MNMWEEGERSLSLLPKSAFNNKNRALQWWHMPLIPALGQQSKADLCGFEASLVYKNEFQDRNKVTDKTCVKKQNKTTTIKQHTATLL